MQIALTWLGKAVVCSYYSSNISKKALSQGSPTLTNYYFFINWWHKRRKPPECYKQLLHTTWGKTHFSFPQVFHLHYKQVLTIHTPVQVFYRKQINLRPWTKPVSHTPRTPLSVSSQIFPQVEIHLFCRANIETCLHTVLYLSTAVVNNCCEINQIFIALGEFDAIKSSSSLNFLSHSLKKSMSI